MMQPNTNLISPKAPETFGTQNAFAVGQQIGAAEKRKQLFNTAKSIFGKSGINEASIDEYVRTTGDTETGQTMLTKFRDDQRQKAEIVGIENEHKSALLNQARLQDDLVLQSYQTMSSMLNGIDWNDNTPEGLRRRKNVWDVVRRVSSQMASYDDKNSLVRGFTLPEAPDANVASALINAGSSLAQQLNERKQWYDEQMGKAGIDLKKRELDIKEKALWVSANKNKDKPVSYSADQRKLARYAVSIGRSIENLEKLEAEGFNEASFVAQVMTAFKHKPKMSTVEFLNIARTPQQQKYLQAQLDFMIPDVRVQSGATIHEHEYASEAQRYFPRPGDSPEALEQKKEARREEYISYRTLAGDLYENIQKNIEADKATLGTEEDQIFDDWFEGLTQ